jgi:hypothetical protein
MEAYRPIRLSLLAASREFGISRTALKARLTNTQPAEDGTFSILQIASAIYSDSKKLKDQTERERGKWYRLRNEIAEGRLLNRERLERGLEMCFIAARQIILGSSLSKRDKNDVMANLANCATVISNVAEQQAREVGTPRKDDDESI